MNSAAEEMTGYDSSSIIGVPFLELMALPKTPDRTGFELERRDTGAPAYTFHSTGAQGKDHYRLIRWSAETVPFDLGSEYRIFSGQDITSRRTAALEEERFLSHIRTEEMFRNLIDGIGDGIFVLEGDTIIFANAALCRMTGYSLDELYITPISSLIHPEDLDEALRRLRIYLRRSGTDPFEYELRVRHHAKGYDILLNIRGRTGYVKGNRVLICNTQDVTERRDKERIRSAFLRDLERNLAHMNSLVELAPVGIWVFKMEEVVQSELGSESAAGKRRTFRIRTEMINDRMCRMLGRDRNDILGRSILDPMFTAPGERTSIKQEILKHLRGIGGSYEVNLRRKDGTIFPVLVEATPGSLNPETGLFDRSITMMIDLTETKKSAEELKRANRELAQSYSRLQELSVIDDLTGVPNRRHFESFLDHEWKRGMRTRGYLSLMIVDVDYFKQYNDTYGHLEGDRCLHKTAEALKKTFNRSADLFARFGGEEFVVVLPDTPIAGAAVVAERLNRAMNALNIPHASSPVAPNVTVSIGVACLIPSDELDRSNLVRRADLALYRAKQRCRNCFQTIDMGEEISDQQRG